MNVETYFAKVLEGIEFIVALGSLIGFTLIIIAIVLLLLGGRYNKRAAYRLIIIGIILLAICGVNTGISYFRIF